MGAAGFWSEEGAVRVGRARIHALYPLHIEQGSIPGRISVVIGDVDRTDRAAGCLQSSADLGPLFPAESSDWRRS